MTVLPVIAVDGPAGSGKGTLARRLAAHFGFDCLDTGLLYRAVGVAVLNAGGNPSQDEPAIRIARTLDGLFSLERLARDKSLRTDEAAQAASKVSAIPAVRTALLEAQRGFASRPPGGKGAVLDGRDIGTVICPEAPVKLFVTASVETRAIRRLGELHSRRFSATYDAVLADLVERDARDSGRATSPLKPAVDAVVLDTTHLDPDAAFAAALAVAKQRLGKSS